MKWMMKAEERQERERERVNERERERMSLSLPFSFFLFFSFILFSSHLLVYLFSKYRKSHFHDFNFKKFSKNYKTV